MTDTDTAALVACIHDPLARFALADWLEEIGDDDAAEMVRTMHFALLPLLESRRVLQEKGHVTSNAISVSRDGAWNWWNFRPTESHRRPLHRPATPDMPADWSYTAFETARGQSDWLERLFARIAAKKDRPGDFALRDATLAYLGLEWAEGASSQSGLLRLNLCRKPE